MNEQDLKNINEAYLDYLEALKIKCKDVEDKVLLKDIRKAIYANKSFIMDSLTDSQIRLFRIMINRLDLCIDSFCGELLFIAEKGLLPKIAIQYLIDLHSREDKSEEIEDFIDNL